MHTVHMAYICRPTAGVDESRGAFTATTTNAIPYSRNTITKSSATIVVGCGVGGMYAATTAAMTASTRYQ